MQDLKNFIKPAENRLLSLIRDRLIKQLEINQLILFGSYAAKKNDTDSDIDLIVILNQKGVSKSYTEKIQKRTSVTRLLNDIRKQVPMDVLVYTKDEWEMLVQQNTSFIKEVKSTGVNLI